MLQTETAGGRNRDIPLWCVGSLDVAERDDRVKNDCRREGKPLDIGSSPLSVVHHAVRGQLKQLRYRFQVPVGLVDMNMPEIR